MSHLSLQFPRAVQCIGKTRAHILNADMLLEFRLMHQPQGLLPRPTKDEFPLRFVNEVRKPFECL